MSKTHPRMLFAALVCATVLVLPSSFAAVETAPAAVGPPTRRDDASVRRDQLIEAILRASGNDEPQALQERKQLIQHEIDALVARLGHRPPSYRRARKLHNVLHREFLRQYDADADRIDGVVLTGRYNCVSAVLLYGLAARALGYRPQVLAYPGHVLLRISIGERELEVETTSPYGFDVGWLLHPSRQGGDRSWLHPDVRQHPAESHRYGERGGSVWLVSFDAAVGFAWINEAWRALEAGQSVQAAEHVLEARRYLPDLDRAEGIRRLIVQAFRTEYESGRYDDAYHIARTDVQLFPDSTTSRDRIIAAALKRIESACDAEAPWLGNSILDEVGRLSPGAEFDRLKRRSTPLIAAAAVRVGDWSLARRAAERYAEVQPDPVEATRLMDWVELRGSAELQRSDECVATDGAFQPESRPH